MLHTKFDDGSPDEVDSQNDVLRVETRKTFYGTQHCEAVFANTTLPLASAILQNAFRLFWLPLSKSGV